MKRFGFFILTKFLNLKPEMLKQKDYPKKGYL
jgi:hypothetical protein